MVAEPVPTRSVGKRLQYVASLLARAGRLPAAPLLVWREADAVLHAPVGGQLVVGRAPGEGLALKDDQLLSRRHFKVQMAGDICVLEDLKSRNGTRVNETEKIAKPRELHDGDLIHAGNHIFAYLDQRKLT